MIKPGECQRIVIHEEMGNVLQLTTNFSGCFPRDISFDNRNLPLVGAIPVERVTLLERNQFYPPGEIVVDNEDENFHLIDSSNNRKRLADLIKKENVLEVENDHFEHILGNCIDVVSQIRLVYGILFRELPPILSWPVLLLRA